MLGIDYGLVAKFRCEAPVPAPEVQATEVRALVQDHADFVLGQTWYCVSMAWWNAWNAYVAFEASSAGGEAAKSRSVREIPGPILNGHLVAERLHLKEHVAAEVDFHLVHKAVWKRISAWYGFDTAIPREVMLGAGGCATVDLRPRAFTASSNCVSTFALLYRVHARSPAAHLAVQSLRTTQL